MALQERCLGLPVRLRCSAPEQPTFDIVDEIGHADLGGRPCDTDCSDEQVHPVLLRSEDVHDPGADLDFSALARRVVSDIGRPFGFLRWMRLTKPFFSRFASLAADRWAVGPDAAPVLVLSSSPRAGAPS